MAVDRGYGSGHKNTGMKKPVSPRAASAGLRRTGIKAAAKKYTNVTTSKAKMLSGTSDYITQENAARKQLGVAGLSARTRQLPTAARAFTKEMTGIDISRRGVSVDPLGVAMALPVGKVLKVAKTAKALRTAGKVAQAVENLEPKWSAVPGWRKMTPLEREQYKINYIREATKVSLKGIPAKHSERTREHLDRLNQYQREWRRRNVNSWYRGNNNRRTEHPGFKTKVDIRYDDKPGNPKELR